LEVPVEGKDHGEQDDGAKTDRNVEPNVELERVFFVVKPNLSRVEILLTITLGLPLTLVILAFLSRLTGSADAVFALFLFCTVSVYFSLAAGVLVPIGIAVVWLFGGTISRRTMVALLILSVLNIGLAVTWIRMVVPQAHFRY